ncbi:hypothetical protein M0802_015919 [Mischocyttarus mexicanus]|nr:hypothetical protein M0802_015919 [Mischocyttarus mexicanus]
MLLVDGDGDESVGRGFWGCGVGLEKKEKKEEEEEEEEDKIWICSSKVVKMQMHVFLEKLPSVERCALKTGGNR